MPQEERGDLVGAYRRLLTGDDHAVQLRAAKAWSKWEGLTVTLLPDPEMLAEFTEDQHAIAIARIENHYMLHKGWLEEGQLLKGAEKLRGIPGVIVQGRHDCCTPPRAAWELKRVWPEVELNIVPDGGHLYNEPGILDGLIRATDNRFAGSLDALFARPIAPLDVAAELIGIEIDRAQVAGCIARRLVVEMRR